MGEIQKEWPVLVRVNNFHGFIRPVICQITAWPEWFTAVECCRVLHSRPQKLVNRIKIEFRIDDIWIIRRQIKAALHQQAFIKPLRIR